MKDYSVGSGKIASWIVTYNIGNWDEDPCSQAGVAMGNSGPTNNGCDHGYVNNCDRDPAESAFFLQIIPVGDGFTFQPRCDMASGKRLLCDYCDSGYFTQENN